MLDRRLGHLCGEANAITALARRGKLKNFVTCALLIAKKTLSQERVCRNASASPCTYPQPSAHEVPLTICRLHGKGTHMDARPRGRSKPEVLQPSGSIRVISHPTSCMTGLIPTTHLGYIDTLSGRFETIDQSDPGGMQASDRSGCCLTLFWASLPT